MTSLTQIDDLISSGNSWLGRANELVATREAHEQAYAALADDLRGVVHGEMYSVAYVDQVNGDDENAGTEAAPFASFQAAVNSVPIGGVVRILLIGSYDLTEIVALNGRVVGVIGHGGAAIINLAANGPENGTGYAPGFKADNKLGTNYVGMQSVTINLPADPTTVNSGLNGLIHGVSSTVLRLHSCSIFVPSASNRNVMSSGEFDFLYVSQVTVDSEMPGHWHADAVSGADPAAFPTIFTNLTSL